MERERLLPADTEKERHKLKYRSTKCLNCHHPLDISDQYCPSCSQLNSTKKLAFDDFFNEFFAGIFAYDSRFSRTLRVLLFSPGKISKDYIEGKRVRYANPYRFYLSASILFFLVWSLTHNLDLDLGSPTTEEERVMADSLLAEQKKANPELGFILPSLDTVPDQENYLSETELDSLAFMDATVEKWKLFSGYHQKTEIKDPDAALDSLNFRNSAYNHWLYKKTVDAERFKSDPGLFYSYFLSKLPFIIFFYLPIFALFIWLLYARRPFTYMEHLIFTFHNQTTWFVLFGIAILADSIFETDAAKWIGTFSFIFYLYKAFRTFYGQSRVKTVLKFIIINFLFFILALIAAFFSLLASFAIY